MAGDCFSVISVSDWWPKHVEVCRDDVEDVMRYVPEDERRDTVRTCRNEGDAHTFVCSACGWGDFGEPSHLLEHARYCPNCGSRVEGEATSVTDEERRRVARELRELPTDVWGLARSWEERGVFTACQDQADYYQLHEALCGCLPAEHMHPHDYGELHERLADLIEPPTQCPHCHSDRHFCPVHADAPNREMLLALAGELTGMSVACEEPDTQEGIDADVRKNPYEYWGCVGYECIECPAKVGGKTPDERYEVTSCHVAQMSELLRRQRELDGRADG